MDCCICDVVWYLFLTFVVIQLGRLTMANADLSLLFWQKFGKKPESMKGKVVWVTGASSGIGECLVYDLARAGCKIVISARRVSELERVRKNCIDFWNMSEEDILIEELDLLKYDTHKDIAKRVIEHFGNIDILVNNGGRSQRALIEETDLEVDKALLDLNVVGTISITKAVLPHFVQRKKGHVVITSSIAGKIGAPLSASYSASKFALQGYFDTMRVEYAIHNVKVTSICPGPIYSKITDEAFTGKVDEKYGIPQAINENRMMTEKCSQLMMSAIANQCTEVWISNNPVLFFTYAAQYAPDLTRWLGTRLGMTAIKKLRQA